MNTQNRIILFCYAYVVGIAAAMAAALNPALLPLMRIATGQAFAASAAIYARRMLRSDTSGIRVGAEILLLAVPGLLFGGMRFMDANTVPDTRIGVLNLRAGGAGFQLERELPDLSRISIRKTGPLKGDVVLRLHGEKDHHQRDGDGRQ